MRLLTTGYNTAFWNMGFDEAVLEGVANGSTEPTLRFYGWTPHAISIGYFQGILEEVDTEACARSGVDIVRRITGGGAVFHADELTYSIIIPEKHPLARHDILESYKSILAGIINGFAQFGIQAEFAPINDIVAGGKKISGNAQTRKYGCVLQHGTILLSVDPETMFSLLKVPNEKLKGKLIEDIKQRVTSISSMLQRQVSFEEAERGFIEGYRDVLGEPLVHKDPEPAEEQRALELAETKFSTREWVYKRT